MLGFFAVLLLIAKPVRDAREQWQFGAGRDDAVYMVTAKSLASGGGYRQENLPGRPLREEVSADVSVVHVDRVARHAGFSAHA